MTVDCKPSQSSSKCMPLVTRESEWTTPEEKLEMHSLQTAGRQGHLCTWRTKHSGDFKIITILGFGVFFSSPLTEASCQQYNDAHRRRCHSNAHVSNSCSICQLHAAHSALSTAPLRTTAFPWCWSKQATDMHPKGLLACPPEGWVCWSTSLSCLLLCGKKYHKGFEIRRS